MTTKAVIFEVSGECPDTGTFTKDEERELPVRLAELFIMRGVCRPAREEAAPAAKEAARKEVRDNG